MGLLKSLWREIARSPASEAPAEALARLGSACRSPDATAREAARAELQQRVHTRPDEVDAHSLLGDLSLADGELDAAQRHYRSALVLQPMHARAQEGLGLCLLRLRQFEQAHLHLETAHKLEPMNSEVLTHWGLVALELGNLEVASQRFSQAIERAPGNAHAWLNLGLTQFRLGRFDLAVPHLQRAVELRPTLALAWSNLALALRQTDDPAGALDAARRAIALRPEVARHHVILGDLLADAGDFPAAEQALAQAVALDPGHVAAAIGQGKLQMALGRHAAAEAAFRRALAAEPQNADAEGGLGQLLLLRGEWATGWDRYEARRRVVPGPVRPVPGPEWAGQPLAGQRLLVHAEQGLGDIILFASCLPELVERTPCVIDVPQRLSTLFQRSFPQAQVLGHDVRESGPEWLAHLPPFDLHVPIGSLPRQLRRNDAAFPRHGGYLHADPAAVEAWRARLEPGRRLRIGLSWRGGLMQTAGRQRSLSLADLLARLAGIDAQWVCLQYGEVQAELDAARASGQAVHPGLSGYGSIDDMAALTTALDGVITVCSTQAHLCGALGTAAAVLVPANPSWRYGATGSRSPWYPSLELLRQSQAGDWSSALDEARTWLRARSADLDLTAG